VCSAPPSKVKFGDEEAKHVPRGCSSSTLRKSPEKPWLPSDRADVNPGKFQTDGSNRCGWRTHGRASAGVHYTGTLTLTDDGEQVIATMTVRLSVVGEQRLDQPQNSSVVLPSDETSATPDACAADDAPATAPPSVPLTTTPVPDPATESSAPPLPVSPLPSPDAPGLSESDEASCGVDATLTPLPCGDATRTADVVYP